MEKIQGGLSGCVRCPECLQAPGMTIVKSAFNDEDLVSLQCGAYVAYGEHLEQAVKHWNIFITYMLAARSGKAA